MIQNPWFMPDCPQNWITCSLCHARHTLKISERSVHNFSSYLANTQTNKQTDRQTKTGKKHNLLGGGNKKKRSNRQIFNDENCPPSKFPSNTLPRDTTSTEINLHQVQDPSQQHHSQCHHRWIDLQLITYSTSDGQKLTKKLFTNSLINSF